MCVAFSYYCCFFLPRFSIVCPLKYLRIERHLAAKTGTNLAVSDLMGSFSRRYLLRVLLFCLTAFFSMSFHQVEMISFL